MRDRPTTRFIFCSPSPVLPSLPPFPLRIKLIIAGRGRPHQRRRRTYLIGAPNLNAARRARSPGHRGMIAVVIYAIERAARNLHKSGQRVRCFNRADLRFDASRPVIPSFPYRIDPRFAVRLGGCFQLVLPLILPPVRDRKAVLQQKNRKANGECIEEKRKSSLCLMRKATRHRGRSDDGKRDSSALFRSCDESIPFARDSHVEICEPATSRNARKDARRSASCILLSLSLALSWPDYTRSAISGPRFNLNHS